MPPARSPARAAGATAADGAAHLLDAAMFWTLGGGGGVHRVVSTKRALLTARGWRHTLLAPGAQGSGRIDCGGWRIPASGGYRFVVDRGRAARLIEQAHPDIVEAADPYRLGWAVLDAAARLGVPAVAFCHSNLPALLAHLVRGPQHGRGVALRRRLGEAVERRARRYLARLYGRYDLVLAPSRTMVAQLRDWGIAQAQHQPLGVDCAVFSPAARDLAWRARLCERLALPPGTRLLAYAGRFAPEKNLGVLTDALQRLGRGHALLAVGGGPQPPVGDAVRVLPVERDSHQLARLIASCDAFVHPGDQETFGLAALEAMACGTPLVARAAAGLGELVDGAGTAVHTLDAADWAEAITTGLAQPRQSALTDAALQRARAHDWNVVLDSWAARYRQAIDSRRRSTGHDDHPAAAAQVLQP